jgi:hypothetical protein
MPYQKLVTVVGLTTFWLCFSSLWAERAGQKLDLPLNLFKDWAPASQRASDVGMIAIYVCWPFVLVTLYLLCRFAQERLRATSRWQRLPTPFDAHHGLRPREKSVYRLFFLMLFWVVPMINVAYFGQAFFDRTSNQPAVFNWNMQSWILGTRAMYGGLTYFGWTPVVVIAALVAIAAMNVVFLIAFIRRAQGL